MARIHTDGRYLRIEKVDTINNTVHCKMYKDGEMRTAEKTTGLDAWSVPQSLIIDTPTLANYLENLIDIPTQTENYYTALIRIGYLALKETKYYTDEDIIEGEGENQQIFAGGWSDDI